MIDKQVLDLCIRNDSDIADVDQFDKSSYRFNVKIPTSDESSYGDGLRAELVATNDLNPMLIQILYSVSIENLASALKATSKIPMVGVAMVGNSVVLRYGFFVNHSDMLAITNGIRVLAMAAGEYMSLLGDVAAG